MDEDLWLNKCMNTFYLRNVALQINFNFFVDQNSQNIFGIPINSENQEIGFYLRFQESHLPKALVLRFKVFIDTLVFDPNDTIFTKEFLLFAKNKLRECIHIFLDDMFPKGVVEYIPYKIEETLCKFCMSHQVQLRRYTETFTDESTTLNFKHPLMLKETNETDLGSFYYKGIFKIMRDILRKKVHRKVARYYRYNFRLNNLKKLQAYLIRKIIGNDSKIVMFKKYADRLALENIHLQLKPKRHKRKRLLTKFVVQNNFFRESPSPYLICLDRSKIVNAQKLFQKEDGSSNIELFREFLCKNLFLFKQGLTKRYKIQKPIGLSPTMPFDIVMTYNSDSPLIKLNKFIKRSLKVPNLYEVSNLHRTYLLLIKSKFDNSNIMKSTMNEFFASRNNIDVFGKTWPSFKERFNHFQELSYRNFCRQLNYYICPLDKLKKKIKNRYQNIMKINFTHYNKKLHISKGIPNFKELTTWPTDTNILCIKHNSMLNKIIDKKNTIHSLGFHVFSKLFTKELFPFNTRMCKVNLINSQNRCFNIKRDIPYESFIYLGSKFLPSINHLIDNSSKCKRIFPRNDFEKSFIITNKKLLKNGERFQNVCSTISRMYVRTVLFLIGLKYSTILKTMKGNVLLDKDNNPQLKFSRINIRKIINFIINIFIKNVLPNCKKLTTLKEKLFIKQYYSEVRPSHEIKEGCDQSENFSPSALEETFRDSSELISSYTESLCEEASGSTLDITSVSSECKSDNVSEKISENALEELPESISTEVISNCISETVATYTIDNVSVEINSDNSSEICSEITSSGSSSEERKVHKSVTSESGPPGRRILHKSRRTSESSSESLSDKLTGSISDDGLDSTSNVKSTSFTDVDSSDSSQKSFTIDNLGRSLGISSYSAAEISLDSSSEFTPLVLSHSILGSMTSDPTSKKMYPAKLNNASESISNISSGITQEHSFQKNFNTKSRNKSADTSVSSIEGTTNLIPEHLSESMPGNNIEKEDKISECVGDANLNKWKETDPFQLMFIHKPNEVNLMINFISFINQIMNLIQSQKNKISDIQKQCQYLTSKYRLILKRLFIFHDEDKLSFIDFLYQNEKLKKIIEETEPFSPNFNSSSTLQEPNSIDMKYKNIFLTFIRDFIEPTKTMLEIVQQLIRVSCEISKSIEEQNIKISSYSREFCDETSNDELINTSHVARNIFYGYLIYLLFNLERLKDNSDRSTCFEMKQKNKLKINQKIGDMLKFVIKSLIELVNDQEILNISFSKSEIEQKTEYLKLSTELQKNSFRFLSEVNDDFKDNAGLLLKMFTMESQQRETLILPLHLFCPIREKLSTYSSTLEESQHNIHNWTTREKREQRDCNKQLSKIFQRYKKENEKSTMYTKIIFSNIGLVKGYVVENIQHFLIIPKDFGEANSKNSKIYSNEVRPENKEQKTNSTRLSRKSIRKYKKMKNKYKYHNRVENTRIWLKELHHKKNPNTTNGEFVNIILAQNIQIPLVDVCFLEEAYLHTFNNINSIFTYTTTVADDFIQIYKDQTRLSCISNALEQILNKVSHCTGLNVNDIFLNVINDEVCFSLIHQFVTYNGINILVLSLPKLDKQNIFFYQISNSKLESLFIVIFRLKSNFNPDRFSVKNEYYYFQFNLVTQKIFPGCFFSFMVNCILPSLGLMENRNCSVALKDLLYVLISILLISRFLNCLDKSEICGKMKVSIRNIPDIQCTSSCVLNPKKINYQLYRGMSASIKEWLHQLSYLYGLISKAFKLDYYGTPLTELECRGYILSLVDTASSVFFCDTVNVYLHIVKVYLNLCLRCHLFREWLLLKNGFNIIKLKISLSVKGLIELNFMWKYIHFVNVRSISCKMPWTVYCLQVVHHLSITNLNSKIICNLLLKISNRLIYSCVGHLTLNFTNSLWNMNLSDLLPKIYLCLYMFLRYKTVILTLSYHRRDYISSYHVLKNISQFKKRIVLIIYFLRHPFMYQNFKYFLFATFKEVKHYFNIFFNVISLSTREILGPHYFIGKSMLRNYFIVFQAIKIKVRKLIVSALLDARNFHEVFYYLNRLLDFNVKSMHLFMAFNYSYKLFYNHLQNIWINLQKRKPEGLGSVNEDKAKSDLCQLMYSDFLNNSLLFFVQIGKKKNKVPKKILKLVMSTANALYHCERKALCLNINRNNKTFNSLSRPIIILDHSSHGNVIFLNRIFLTTSFFLNFVQRGRALSKMMILWICISEDVIRFWAAFLTMIQKYYQLRCLQEEFRKLLRPILTSIIPTLIPFISICFLEKKKYYDLKEANQFFSDIEKIVFYVKTYRDSAIERSNYIAEKLFYVYLSPYPHTCANVVYLTFQRCCRILRFQWDISRSAEATVINIINTVISKIPHKRLRKNRIMMWYQEDNVRLLDMNSTEYNVHSNAFFKVKCQKLTNDTYKKDCVEFFNFHYQLYSEATLRAFFYSLLLLRSRLEGWSAFGELSPMWLVGVSLNKNEISILPNVYIIKDTLDVLIAFIFETCAYIHTWGNYFNDLFINELPYYITRYTDYIYMTPLTETENFATDKRVFLQRLLRESDIEILNEESTKQEVDDGSNLPKDYNKEIVLMDPNTVHNVNMTDVKKKWRQKLKKEGRQLLRTVNEICHLSNANVEEIITLKFKKKNTKKILRNKTKNIRKYLKLGIFKCHKHRVCKISIIEWIDKIEKWLYSLIHVFRKLISIKVINCRNMQNLISKSGFPSEYVLRIIEVLQENKRRKFIGFYSSNFIKNKLKSLIYRKRIMNLTKAKIKFLNLYKKNSNKRSENYISHECCLNKYLFNFESKIYEEKDKCLSDELDTFIYTRNPFNHVSNIRLKILLRFSRMFSDFIFKRLSDSNRVREIITCSEVDEDMCRAKEYCDKKEVVINNKESYEQNEIEYLLSKHIHNLKNLLNSTSQKNALSINLTVNTKNSKKTIARDIGKHKFESSLNNQFIALKKKNNHSYSSTKTHRYRIYKESENTLKNESITLNINKKTTISNSGSSPNDIFNKMLDFYQHNQNCLPKKEKLTYKTLKKKFRIITLKNKIKKYYSWSWKRKWRNHRTRLINFKNVSNQKIKRLIKYNLVFRNTINTGLKIPYLLGQICKKYLEQYSQQQIYNGLKKRSKEVFNEKENLKEILKKIIETKDPFAALTILKEQINHKFDKFEAILTIMLINNCRDILKYCILLWRAMSNRPLGMFHYKLWDRFGSLRRKIQKNIIFISLKKINSVQFVDELRKTMTLNKLYPLSCTEIFYGNLSQNLEEYRKVNFIRDPEFLIEHDDIDLLLFYPRIINCVTSSDRLFINNSFDDIYFGRSLVNHFNTKLTFDKNYIDSTGVHNYLCSYYEVLLILKSISSVFMSGTNLLVGALYKYIYSQPRLGTIECLSVFDSILGYFPRLADVTITFKKWNINNDFKQRLQTDIICYSYVGNLEPLNFFLSKLCLEFRFSLNGWLVNNLLHRCKVVMYFFLDNVVALRNVIGNLAEAKQIKVSIQGIHNCISNISIEVKDLLAIHIFVSVYNFMVTARHYCAFYCINKYFSYMLQLEFVQQEMLKLLWKKLINALLCEVICLVIDINLFLVNFFEAGPLDSSLETKIALQRMTHFHSWYDKLLLDSETLSPLLKVFGYNPVELQELILVAKEFAYLDKLYNVYNMIYSTLQSYNETLWHELSVSDMLQHISEFQNRLRKLPETLKEYAAFRDIKRNLDVYNEYCLILEIMANKPIKKRHWTQIENVLNTKIPHDSQNFLVKHVLATKILEYREAVEEICLGAVREGEINGKLLVFKSIWSTKAMFFNTYKSFGEVIFKGLEMGEMMSALEDDIMILSLLLSSRHSAMFRNELELWTSNLSTSLNILGQWINTQNLWVYLEPVFVGGDVPQAIPKQAILFAKATSEWLEVMKKAHSYFVADLASNSWLTKSLNDILHSFEKCLEALAGYLEEKRKTFPRFFFISDTTLLEILAHGSDPYGLQYYLSGIFDNVDKLGFQKGMKDLIISVISREGEIIPLLQQVSATGSLEIWLNKLLIMAKDSLSKVISLGVEFTNNTKFDYLTMTEKFPSQVGLLCVQYLWTKDTESSMREMIIDPKAMLSTNTIFLVTLNIFIDMTTVNLTKYQRVRYETLVTIQIHQRDIYNELVQMGISDPWDFQWLKQERFYFKRINELLLVQITDVNFIYQNEFLGCSDRLVITPLTDRCYITLAQAIGLSMGGAPAGPAGTGKTETTKDMGRSLGKFVVVFNCSDQMDFRGLGRIYKGLAQSGSWGCFDEFNRIELPVLSVAAQQIAILFNAKRNRKSSFIFSDGDHVCLNREFGIFLTMNPGYAGRQELPENLKINFRSVAMMVPDRQIIIRVKLASSGFRENVPLSRKFFVLYALCEEQLSKQIHYDFGLRNILSVLRSVGFQKRSNPNDNEETTLYRVLRDMNTSKLVDEDEPLFLSLLDDLFLGKKAVVTPVLNIQKFIAEACVTLNISLHPAWNFKILQLYETSLVRHGLMIMGPTGTGKTVGIHVLLRSFTDMGYPHYETRMNPKAITSPQMFGKLDVATNDWTDGIFSQIWRRTLKLPSYQNYWIVLDGPVDAVWIENLNSVLDDNKTLTLANGDRIIMANNSKLVFEPDNVDNASPATVSRMGMVFMSSSVLPWRPIFEGWTKRKSKSEAQNFRKMFYLLYDDTLEFIVKKSFPKMQVLEAMYIRQSTDVLDGLLEETSITFGHQEKYFMFSLMWSLGALLESNDREKLELFFQSHQSKLDWPKPNKVYNETIFEFLVTKKGEWANWSTRICEIEYPNDYYIDFSALLVPNIDNVRTNFLIEIIAKQKKAALLIGEPGTAKTVMIKAFLNNYSSETLINKILNFSYATTPNMFQGYIEGYLEKKSGWTYGPPNNCEMILFIDDINMPVINEWGDQITNEILRQLIETKGFYSLDKPGEFMSIDDIQYLAAMIHPGGGRNDIPPRLKRQFNIYNCTLPSEKSIDKIFTFYSAGYFSKDFFDISVVEFVPRLVPLTRIIWQRSKRKLLPTPTNFHYIFNLRDLSRIWEGIMVIKEDVCKSVSTLLKLWQHECTRVISDKLTTQNDRDWFEREIASVANELLSEEYRPYYSPAETYFADFLRDVPEPTGDEGEDVVLEAPKIYEEIPSMEFVRDKLRFQMDQYNELIRGAKMDLVFFKDAVTHIIKISRIIRTPRGCAYLVGIGGSGKQSYTKMSTFIANYKLHQIVLSRTYGVQQFLDDIKIVYRVGGSECQGVTFLFTDNEVKQDDFLEILNNVLGSGVVANLFSKQELFEILNDLPLKMKKLAPKMIINKDNLLIFFFSQVKKNLHVVFSLSPATESFRIRALKFPGLISACTMDWYFRWPMEALVAVSRHFFCNFQMECGQAIKEELTIMMAEVHDNIINFCIEYYDRFRRRVYVTPKSFLSFLNGYKTIYFDKYQILEKMAREMTVGLKRLAEARKATDQLKRDCVVLEKKLRIINENAALIADRVFAAKDELEQIEKNIKTQAALLAKVIHKIVKERIRAKRKVKKGEPALVKAEAALNTITASDIATVRKLGRPPYLITIILDVVCILLKRQIIETVYLTERKFLTASWEESLKVLSDSQFLNKLRYYKRKFITDEMVDLMFPYITYESYTFEIAKTVCGNVAGLLQWSVAMTDYFNAYRVLLPLATKVKKKESVIKYALYELLKKHQYLIAQQEMIKSINIEAIKAENEKKSAQDSADKIRNKMMAATSLIEGLSGEEIRWTLQLETFNTDKMRLVGDALILNGFLTYYGPFNQEYRQKIYKSWNVDLTARRIPLTTNLNIIENLTTVATINKWNSVGLPTDEHSIQNGIIVTNSPRYPLLVDPQSQGYSWIKKMEKKNNINVTSFGQKFFRTQLDDSLSAGYPLMIEDVMEELDPILDNLLEKNFIKLGNSLRVKLGDKEIDVHAKFRMYISTKLRNPSYTPEIYARTSVIDFTVTVKGLEEQLLGLVILHERQELENERKELFKMVTDMKTKLKELEGLLLYKLSAAKGELVEDYSLLLVLNTTKSTAETAQLKLESAYFAQQRIHTFCEMYRSTAIRGSVLYFLVVQISLVHCMYQTSLAQFIERFLYSMENSKINEFPLIRSSYIKEYLTSDIYTYVSRGLYEEHRFLWLLLLTLKVSIEQNVITYQEFHVFIKGGASLDLNDVPNKKYNWITDLVWLNICEISNHTSFKFIIKSINKYPTKWKEWIESDTPEDNDEPDNRFLFTIFEKLLFIRSVRLDRVISMSRKFISFVLGSVFTEPVFISAEKIAEYSKCNTPMICLLTLGADPTRDIEILALKNRKLLSAISMGQGQEIMARKMVIEASVTGNWVLLQNCHLGVDFMMELIIRISNVDSLHKDFRVWITTEPSLKFPIKLLQMSVKFSMDPPQGIKSGMIRLYSHMSKHDMEFTNEEFYPPVLYNICYLHIVAQERRKFGPLGWNIPYEFNDSDLTSSILYLQKHITKEKTVNWVALRYMIGEVMYGGRVTDDYDKRLLKTFCKLLFCSSIWDAEYCFFTCYCTLKFPKATFYVHALQKFSDVDPPQACGLGANASVTFLSNKTKKTLDIILEVEPKESSGVGGENREDVVYNLAKDMLSKLPDRYDPFVLKERLTIMGKLNSLNIFLKQEIDRMQRIIILVDQTLTDLILAIDGSIIMNESLRDALDCIFDAKVPRAWRKGSWVSTSIGFWFTGMLERNKQLSKWIYTNRPNTFWITGFFNPQGFLTAMRQEVARTHPGWSLETLGIFNTVTKFANEEIKKPAEEGVYVYGLFLEGAKWHLDIGLDEVAPKDLYSAIPVVNVFGILSAKECPGLYHCPVYKRKERTYLNFITPLWLPSKENTDHWILRGVALLCDTN